MEIGKEFEVEAKPAIRIDDNVAKGISRTAREKHASLIVMGWNRTTNLRSRLFGSVIDNGFWSSHCPVAVMRLLEEPIDIHRVLVPVKNITPQTRITINFAFLFADTNHASITFLHICDRRAPQEQSDRFKEELSQIVLQPGFAGE